MSTSTESSYWCDQLRSSISLYTESIRREELRDQRPDRKWQQRQTYFCLVTWIVRHWEQCLRSLATRTSWLELGFAFISVAGIKCPQGQQLWGGRVYSSSQFQGTVHLWSKVTETEALDTLHPVKSSLRWGDSCWGPTQNLPQSRSQHHGAHFQACSSPSVKAAETDSQRHTHWSIWIILSKSLHIV